MAPDEDITAGFRWIFNMVTLLVNENQIIWLALIVSLMMHCFLFVFSEKTFIQHAQFSVQPSAQLVEVSIEQMKTEQISSSVILGEAKDLKMPLHISISSQNKIMQKQVIHSKSGVRAQANPNYFQNPSPEYPQLARQMRQEGLVVLLVDVNKGGTPVEVKINQSSGYRLLDQAALKAVQHWKFQPGSLGNIPVESTVTVPIRFQLEKS